MSDTNPAIPTGDIAFFDNYLPSIEDGEYTINAVTEITGAIDTGTYFDNPVTQDFEVRGPQFTLPVSEIHSVYPPNNSNSKYDQQLPNIAFNKRLLPWERYFDKNDKTIPWLCLLTFTEDEITIDPETRSSLTTSTVDGFLTPDGDVLKPDIPVDSVPADVLSTNCSAIQISSDVFNALVPKVDELKYLSHVRQVDTGDQAIMNVDETGWFSVITGNRLLKTSSQAGTRFYVHLVSLEGYYDIMNGTVPWPKKKSTPSSDKDIALVSLYNWTFLSQPEKLNFKELVENFAAQAGKNTGNLLLRRQVVPPENPDQATLVTLNRLQNGYVPLNYKTPVGDVTFSWFRGPLSPVIARPLPRSSGNYHFPSASSMMIYDNNTGIFDQSYAAAWSMGRAQGLADGVFSRSLLQYRKKAYNIIGKLMDFMTSADEATPADLRQIIQSSVVLDNFKTFLNKNSGESLTEAMKKPLVPSHTKNVNNDEATSENPVDLAKSFFAEPVIQNFLKEEIQDELIPVAQWLAHIQLLYNIPFNHLVPDQLALPVESLRFFYLDQNWLDSLVDGAISIGVQSSKDSFFNSVMRGVINDAVAAETKVIRSKLLGVATGDTEADSTKEALSGILIRSAVVSGWPGLVIKGFKGDYETGTQLKTLRMDRLSSNVLLCIFLDIPDTVILAEPQQGLCFGIEDGDIINLRQLSDPPGKPTGKNFPASGGFNDFFRPTTGNIGSDVLNINDGTDSVVQSMAKSQYLNATIGPAQFAMQMVKAPEEISFIQSKD